ncbi:efflux RND transporter periplasmic adaptor subunit [Sulfitobacter faviae]|uniref:Efflux RND transporter periplasmic adaptor subunit n=1 Tax=Sulfitobacter faviae TaxID=1775881 RepID=A0ABZ0V5G4_9RHOB|nr:efflux RND transporter periplasmic adaptor subunit [Sulfitobacter faviae]WPZ22277.1 efflux RND transporter periplasmic adaptor subunit [Sulfitobacter faviae]
MPDTESHTPKDHEAKHRGIRFSMPKVILSIAALVLGAGAILTTFGSVKQVPGAVVLDQAFVHGAVTQVGIGEAARISELHVDLGDRVDVGDTVATLDRRDIESERRELNAKRDHLMSELRAAEVSGEIVGKEDEINALQAEAEERSAASRVTAAEAELQRYVEELQRSRTLAERNIISDAELAVVEQKKYQADANLARRKAELQASRSATKLAETASERSKVRKAQQDVLRKRIAEVDADLATLEEELAMTLVDAKEAGIVVEVDSRAGSSVQPGASIVSIWNTDRIWMRAWVPEDQVALVRAGDPASIRVDALGDQSFPGVVRRILVSKTGEERTLPGQPISPLLPDESRFAVQVEFDPGAYVDELLPGMSGDVEIHVDQREGQINPAADEEEGALILSQG